MDSVNNFRDVLIYNSKDNLSFKKNFMFRAGKLDNINKNDLNILKSFGVKTIIDLRVKEEKKKIKYFNDFKTIEIPINIYDLTKGKLKPILNIKNNDKNIIEAINDVYLQIAEIFKPDIKNIFNILTNLNNYPLVFHCSHGKDRTGFLAALIHNILNINEENIIKDYLLTNEHIFKVAKKKILLLKILTLGYIPMKNYYTAFTSFDIFIKTAFETINKNYGNLTNYLNICGVYEDDLFKFKKNILIN